MNVSAASTAWQQTAATSTSPWLLPGGGSRRSQLRTLFPLIAICLVQTGLSLSLVWSNTAFADEAQYLASGHLEWAHWLHGVELPPYLASTFSGSPVVYPPLGALADSIGGLAAARILSLVFMVCATVLLYLSASRLLGRTAATVAAALWALSEPTIRLAFATFDPLSVLLTALSAWLIVIAGYGRRRLTLVALASAAVSLALANAAAYSGVIIDPVVVGYAYLVWLSRRGSREASLLAIGFTGTLVGSFVLFMSVSGSWTGLMSEVINRGTSDHQSLLLVLYDSWGYSGLIAILAVIGAIAAFSDDNRQRMGLVALLGCTALVIPLAQFHEQTAWSLDKHLAYGTWFAVMAAGYGCSRLIRLIPGIGRTLAWLFFMIALIFPAINSWNSAWKVYHAWPDARAYVGAMTVIERHDRGPIDVTEKGPENIAEYYTKQGPYWHRWSTAISLDPVKIRQSAWGAYYMRQLQGGKFGAVALFYATTFSSAPDLPGRVLLSPRSTNINQELLSLVGDNSGEPGLPALTLAVEHEADYRLAAVGPYDSATENGVYAIWQRRVRT